MFGQSMTPDEYITTEVARVRRLIQAAYASVPRPSRVTKRVAIALDDEWLPDEARCAALRALDLEKHWKDLDDAAIEEFGSILPWLDEEGIRFYLPAFMDFALRRYPWQGSRATCDVHEFSWGRPELLQALSADQFDAYAQFETLYGNSVIRRLANPIPNFSEK